MLSRLHSLGRTKHRWTHTDAEANSLGHRDQAEKPMWLRELRCNASFVHGTTRTHRASAEAADALVLQATRQIKPQHLP